MPKRKFEELESEGSEERVGDSATSEDSNSSVHTSSSADVPSAETASTSGGFSCMRRGKRVKFKGVTVFYFQRKQGFVCVPSQGGSTLGMCESHTTADDFSIKEFARHQRRLHLDILAQQKGSKFAGTLKDNRRNSNSECATGSLNGDSDSSNSSDEELNVDDYYFLQPVPTRQRRLMLRQAGIKKIDTLEKEECKDIRTSRESCGCDCRVYCEPETCACSLAGIKCQVDRLSFPCGCSKEGCGNLSGRIEFNPIRVRTHFIHTLMRLEMDKKQEEEKAQREQRLRENGPTQAESSPVCPELVTDPDPPSSTLNRDSVSEDATMYNSNERGSCCDCQNSDIHEFMMQESQFNGGVSSGGVNSPSASQQDTSQGGEYLGGGVGNGTEPANSNHCNKTGENLPQVLLFNDSDDDYSGESSTTMYPFNKEDSSYSESSDCSSEASVSENDHNHVSGAFPTFTDNPSYDVNSASLDPTQAGNFCMQPSVLQPDAKFLDLTEPGASYKLEPISEILNPVRFPAYGSGSTGATWCGENYGGYPSGEQNGQVAPAPVCDQEMPKAREYLYTVETDATSSTDSLGPMLSPSAQMPEQYLELPYEGAQNLKPQSQNASAKPATVNLHTNGLQENHANDEGSRKEERSYHDLSASASTPDAETVSILPLPVPHDTMRSPCSQSPSSLRVLNVKQQVDSENGLDQHSSAVNLGHCTPTSRPNPAPQENPKPLTADKLDDLSPDDHPQQLLAADSYPLPHKPGPYAVHGTSPLAPENGDLQTEACQGPTSKFNCAKELPSLGEKNKRSEVDETSSVTPNFGEMIKESIVETVSA